MNNLVQLISKSSSYSSKLIRKVKGEITLKYRQDFMMTFNSWIDINQEYQKKFASFL